MNISILSSVTCSCICVCSVDQIKYGSRQEGIPSLLKDIPGNTSHSHEITGLRKFVQYEVHVLAYTRMGDGKLSQPEVSVTTLEDCE